MGNCSTVQGAELVLCDDLEGWDGGMGGRVEREWIYVYLWLIHTVVQQKSYNTVKQLYSN